MENTLLGVADDAHRSTGSCLLLFTAGQHSQGVHETTENPRIPEQAVPARRHCANFKFMDFNLLSAPWLWPKPAQNSQGRWEGGKG